MSVAVKYKGPKDRPIEEIELSNTHSPHARLKVTMPRAGEVDIWRGGNLQKYDREDVRKFAELLLRFVNQEN